MEQETTWNHMSLKRSNEQIRCCSATGDGLIDTHSISTVCWLDLKQLPRDDAATVTIRIYLMLFDHNEHKEAKESSVTALWKGDMRTAWTSWINGKRAHRACTCVDWLPGQHLSRWIQARPANHVMTRKLFRLDHK